MRLACASTAAGTPTPDVDPDRGCDWRPLRSHISHALADPNVDRCSDLRGLYCSSPHRPEHRFRYSTFRAHRKPLRGLHGRSTGPRWTPGCFEFYPYSGTVPPGRYDCTARRPYRPRSAVDNGESGPAGPAVRLVVNLISHLLDLAYRLALGATREARSLHGCSLVNVYGDREPVAVGFC